MGPIGVTGGSQDSSVGRADSSPGEPVWPSGKVLGRW